jgi:3-oxoadipate enol-lactonase
MTAALRLGYKVDGVDRSGLEPVVLVGALGTTTAMWVGQVGELGRERVVVRVDLLGHGESAVPIGPYTLELLGNAVLALLDGLGVGRVALAGVWLGGMVGMWLAAHRPARVTRLAVLCSSAYRPPASNWTERAKVIRAEGMAGERDRLPGVWFTPAFRTARPEVVSDYLDGLVATPPEGYASCCEAIGAMDLRPALPSITAPTLVVSGVDDPASPPEHGRAIAGAVMGARFVAVPQAAHLANVEQPVPVTRLLANHFSGGHFSSGREARA